MLELSVHLILLGCFKKSRVLEQKALDAVEKDLSAVSSALKSDSRLADFLNDPSVQKGVISDDAND